MEVSRLSHHLAALVLLPVLLYFSSSFAVGLRLFFAYVLLFYFPGYCLLRFFFPEIAEGHVRSVLSLFIGIPVIPQLLYYLSLFSSPVNVAVVSVLGLFFVAAAVRLDLKD